MLQNSVSQGNLTYVNLSNGNFVIPTNASDPNAKQRTNKLGREVYELIYNELSGYISNIEIKSRVPYGETSESECLNMLISDGNEKYAMSLFLSERTAKELINQIITFSGECAGLPIKIKGYNFIAKETMKTITGYTVFINNEKLSKFATKEAPNGLPEMVKVKVKGKDTWDDTEQIVFFTAKIKEWLSSQKFNQAHESSESVSVSIAAQAPTSDGDDLPF